MFQKAKRSKNYLKIAMNGISGSGKTYSSLRFARGFVGEKGRIALIDTENGSASNYDALTEFDVLDIAPPFESMKFVNAIQSAVQAKYDILIIDSASHVWKWVLEYKTMLDKRGGNSFTNWSDAGKNMEQVINTVLQSQIHVIFCMRSKTEYVLETNEKGKQAPIKVGLAPVMRDGIEYEFTTVFDIDIAHNASTSKDRTGLFVDKIEMITEETGRRLREWHEDGDDPKTPQDYVESLILLTGKTEEQIVEKIIKHCNVTNFNDVTIKQLDELLVKTIRKYHNK
jgi:hypothetical protein